MGDVKVVPVSRNRRGECTDYSMCNLPSTHAKSFGCSATAGSCFRHLFGRFMSGTLSKKNNVLFVGMQGSKLCGRIVPGIGLRDSLYVMLLFLRNDRSWYA